MANREDTYLFIDGEYLRRIYREAMEGFFGVEGDLDPGRLRMPSTAGRAFFYDCLDDIRRDGESEAEFQARVSAQEEFFGEIQAVSGFHVRLGTLKGEAKRRRQKEVDILLAVDMLSHGFNGNMKQALLIAGDLDFRPIVEALVREGVFLEVWYDRKSLARELPGAADFGRELRLTDLHAWSRQLFMIKYQLPYMIGGDRRPDGFSVEKGRVGNCPAELINREDMYYVYVPNYSGNSLTIQDKDRARLERFVELQFEPIVWDVAVGTQ